jgi:hypothetical protein
MEGSRSPVGRDLVYLCSSDSPDGIPREIYRLYLSLFFSEYEAMSYVWGTAHEDVVILLNGPEFLVGETLASRLRHVRSTTEDKPLWADAFCINQKDLEEHNDQVALMRDIILSARASLSGSERPPLVGLTLRRRRDTPSRQCPLFSG